MLGIEFASGKLENWKSNFSHQETLEIRVGYMDWARCMLKTNMIFCKRLGLMVLYMSQYLDTSAQITFLKLLRITGTILQMATS